MDHKGLKAIRDRQGRMEKQGHRVNRDPRDHKGRMEKQDHRALKGNRASRDHQDLMEHPDSPAGTSTAMESRIYLQRISMATW